jgi:tetratricopeptide (TPR) repeat protein
MAEESLAIRRELGDRGGVALALNTLGNLAFEQGEYSSARACYSESLAIERGLGDKRGIAFSLEGLAEVVAALGSARRAAGIWGAAERLREEIGSPLAPNERPRYERGVVAARASLGDDAAFNGAWQEGRASTLEEAIAIALAEAAERQPWIGSP